MMLTYKDCQNLWAKKARSRSYKRMSTYLRLRLEGENFVVTGLSDSVRILTVCPDNIALAHFDSARNYLGPCSVVYHFRHYVGLDIHHRTDRRSTQRWWYTCNGVKYPVAGEIEIDLRTGEVLSKLPEVKRRQVVRSLAKPIREGIAAWEKLATTYFATGDPETIIRAYKNQSPAKMPDAGNEPSVVSLLKLVREYFGMPWFLTHGSRDADWVVGRLKAAFNTAFEKWKE